VRVTLVTALVAAFGLAAVALMAVGARRWRRHRYAAGAAHAVSSLAVLGLAGCIALVGANLLTYARLTHEQPAARVSFTRAGDAQFDARLTYPSGETQNFALRGDEWQIDARVLKWRPLANIVGFDTAYRLERIAGRYSDIDRERTALRTVYALNPPDRVDVWALVRAWHRYVPWIDALYGSAVYLPMTDGALYEVVVTQSGLIGRPLNQAARQAVGNWR
jgi:hypothetical protein